MNEITGYGFIAVMVYRIRYFDINWYLMFMMIVLRLLVDGSVTIVF